MESVSALIYDYYIYVIRIVKLCHKHWRLTSECRCYCGEPSHLWFNQHHLFDYLFKSPSKKCIFVCIRSFRITPNGDDPSANRRAFFLRPKLSKRNLVRERKKITFFFSMLPKKGERNVFFALALYLDIKQRHFGNKMTHRMLVTTKQKWYM